MHEAQVPEPNQHVCQPRIKTQREAHNCYQEVVVQDLRLEGRVDQVPCRPSVAKARVGAFQLLKFMKSLLINPGLRPDVAEKGGQATGIEIEQTNPCGDSHAAEGQRIDRGEPECIPARSCLPYQVSHIRHRSFQDRAHASALQPRLRGSDRKFDSGWELSFFSSLLSSSVGKLNKSGFRSISTSMSVGHRCEYLV